MPTSPPTSERSAKVGGVAHRNAWVTSGVSQLFRLPISIMSRPIGVQASWVIVPFAVLQVVRLGTNIILTHLLDPEMFGLMLIVNTLRTGTELLSDIGIGQSIVRAKQTPDRAFLNVAWTLQVGRGALLTLVMLILAGPISGLYGHELKPILLVVSSLFLLTGLQSPALFLMQRNMQLRQRAAYDVMCTIVQCAMTIALAYFMASVWALVWGLILSTGFSTALSYALGERHLPRFALHTAHLWDILHFGKWVFLATLIYFAATSTDKALFGAILPMAAVGVYSVARTFSDMAGGLAQRLGAFVVFPKIAALNGQQHADLRGLRQTRRHALSMIAGALGLGIAVSDAFVLLVYDTRYHAAAFMLPVLLAGVWFAVLANFAESMLLGCDRPAQVAMGNGVKFAALAGGLTLAFEFGGLFAALIVIAVAEAARWLALTQALDREKLAFLRDDLALTVLLLSVAGIAKLVLGEIGLVPSFADWWALGAALRG